MQIGDKYYQHYSVVFLSIVGAGTSASSQILFLIGLSVSTLSSHWVSLNNSITASMFSSKILDK